MLPLCARLSDKARCAKVNRAHSLSLPDTWKSLETGKNNGVMTLEHPSLGAVLKIIINSI